jgi:phosphoribosylanthranilate isomerase
MALRLPGRFQVAGVIDEAEAALIIESGADMLGFPLALKDNRADLDVATAAAIVEKFSGQAAMVCITYLDRATEVAALCRELGARWVQLHGTVALSEVEALKVLVPALGIIKCLVVRSGKEGEVLREMKRFEPVVDAFITDTYDPATGRTGATGKPHDWSVSRAVAARSIRPLILAGGLSPENVRDAIAAVRPAAVDAHTGLEGPDGRKDPALITQFVSRARAAFEKTGSQHGRTQTGRHLN